MPQHAIAFVCSDGSGRRIMRVVSVLMFAATIGGCGAEGAGPDESGEPTLPRTIGTIAFVPAAATIAVSEVRGLTPDIRDDRGAPYLGVTGLSWSSSNAAVASVDQFGGVRGVAFGGPVTISASKDGVSGTLSVNVVPAGILVSPEIDGLAVGETVQLSGTLRDWFANPLIGGPIRWSTNLPGIARVDEQSGALTGVAPGTVVVAATAHGVTSTIAILVGVPSAYDGEWVAPTSNRELLITVLFGKVTRFRIPVVASVCNATIMAEPAVDIVADEFSFVAHSASVSGRFSATDRMEGSHTRFALSWVCEPGTAIINPPAELPATAFTASRR